MFSFVTGKLLFHLWGLHQCMKYAAGIFFVGPVDFQCALSQLKIAESKEKRDAGYYQFRFLEIK